jgi:hypothetical protein
MQVQLYAPEALILESLDDTLMGRLRLEAPHPVHLTHLDSFDWRLYRRGCRLVLEWTERGRTLHWCPGIHEPAQLLSVDKDIRFYWDLPPGFLRSALERTVERRALLPMGSSRVDRQLGRLVDADGNTTANLYFERAVPLDRSGRPIAEMRSIIRVHGVPGQEDLHRELVAQLRAAGAVDDKVDALTLAAAAYGRSPGDYRSKPKIALSSDESSAAALRQILMALLRTLQANVNGVLEDLDVEFLHDLRVATRRTRSALGQLRGVLPAAAREEFGPEFKWLGAATGPCRDLDVFLLEMESYQKQLGDSAVDFDRLQPQAVLLARVATIPAADRGMDRAPGVAIRGWERNAQRRSPDL